MIYLIPYIFTRITNIIFSFPSKKEILALMEEGRLNKNKFIELKNN
jgi:hypothetical protein